MNTEENQEAKAESPTDSQKTSNLSLPSLCMYMCVYVCISWIFVFVLWCLGLVMWRAWLFYLLNHKFYRNWLKIMWATYALWLSNPI